MKKLNKSIALFLVGILLIASMAGCSKAPKTMFEALKEAQKFTAYNVQTELEVTSDNQTVTINADGMVDQKNQAMQLDLSASVSGVTLSIGTMTLKDGIFYLDASDLLDSISTLTGMSLDEETLKETVSQLGLEDSFKSYTVYGMEVGTTSDEAKKAGLSLSDSIIAALEAGSKAADGCMSKDSDTFILTADGTTLPSLIEGILTYVQENLDSMYDNLLVILKEGENNKATAALKDMAEQYGDLVSVDTSELDDLLDNAEDYKQKAKDQIQEILDDMDSLKEMLSEESLQLKMSVDFTGKSGSRICTTDITADLENNTSMHLMVEMSEAKVSIEAPEEYTDLMTVLNAMMDLYGNDDIIGDLEDDLNDDLNDELGLDEETEAETETEASSDESDPDDSTSATDGIRVDSGAVIHLTTPAGYTLNNMEDDYFSFTEDTSDGFIWGYVYDFDDWSGAYTADDYYEAEITPKLEDPDTYVNLVATDYRTMTVGDYEVHYITISYQYDGDESTNTEVYSYTDLGGRDDAGLCIEYSFYDDEWDTFLATCGSIENSLTDLYGAVTVTE